MLNKILAIIKKDFLQESSYRFALLLNLAGMAASLSIYYFIDRLFAGQLAPHLKAYGVSYFSYVLVGLAFFSYIGVGLGSFSTRIRDEQLQGTLEFLLLTPTGAWTLLVGMGIWNLCFATLQLVSYAALGILIFQVNFSQINVLSTLAVLFLTIVTFSSLGILSASVILIFKRGNPIDWLLSTTEGILGGVYFPITVLPVSLQFLAQLLPITYAIRALQLTVYQGASLAEIRGDLLVLTLFAISLFPLSLYTFSAALKRAKHKGTLAQY